MQMSTCKWLRCVITTYQALTVQEHDAWTGEPQEAGPPAAAAGAVPVTACPERESEQWGWQRERAEASWREHADAETVCEVAGTVAGVQEQVGVQAEEPPVGDLVVLLHLLKEGS